MWENADQKNSEDRHFSRSEMVVDKSFTTTGLIHFFVLYNSVSLKFSIEFNVIKISDNLLR